LKMAWHTYLPTDGRRDRIFAMQVLDRQLLFELRNGAVLSLDPATGALQWQARVGVPYAAATGFGTNATSLFIGKGVQLYALDRVTGAHQWEFTLPLAPSAAAVADDERIFVPAGTDKLLALELPKAEEPAAPAAGKDKKQEKSSESSSGMTGAPSSGQKAVSSLNSGGQYVRSVSALSSKGQAVRSIGPLSSATQARQGESLPSEPRLLWTYKTETRPETRLEQVCLLTDNYLFEAGANGLFFAVSKFEPRIFYNFHADAPVSAPLGQHGDTAYVPSEDYRLYALEIATGRILWRFVAGGRLLQKPRITEESIYLAAERAGLYRIDRITGEMIWRNSHADRFLAVNKKFVYAADNLGTLLILDRATGVQLASYAGTREFVVPLANEVDDRIYLASNDGLLICLHDRDYAKPFLVQETARKQPAKDGDKKQLGGKAGKKTTDKPAAKGKPKDDGDMPDK